MSRRLFPAAILGVVLLATGTNFVSLPTGRESRVVLSLAFAAALAGVWLLRAARGHENIAVRFALPIGAFIGAGAFSWIWSQLTADALLWIWPSFPMVQVAALFVNSALPLMLLITASVIHDVVWRERFVALLIIVGLVNLAARIFLPSLTVVLENGTRGLFVAWSSGAAMLWLLYRWRESTPVQRIAAGALVVGNLYHYFIVHRIWMSGWLPMFVVWFAMAWLRSRRLGAVVTLFLIGFLAFNFDDLYRSIVLDNLDEGGLQRLELWAMNLQHVANHPVFGLGPAGYAPYNMTYHPRDARSTHNNYFDVLAQTGIVGAACFVWILASIGRTAWRTHRGMPADSFMHGYSALAFSALCAALFAMMLGDWVLPFAYNQSITGFDNAVISWIGWGMAGRGKREEGRGEREEGRGEREERWL
jgi:hypothetical protein